MWRLRPTAPSRWANGPTARPASTRRPSSFPAAARRPCSRPVCTAVRCAWPWWSWRWTPSRSAKAPSGARTTASKSCWAARPRTANRSPGCFAGSPAGSFSARPTAERARPTPGPCWGKIVYKVQIGKRDVRSEWIIPLDALGIDPAGADPVPYQRHCLARGERRVPPVSPVFAGQDLGPDLRRATPVPAEKPRPASRSEAALIARRGSPGARRATGARGSWWMTFVAVTLRRYSQGGSPVLELTSNRGKVAAGDVDPDAVPFLEAVRARVELDVELVDRARLHEGLFLIRVAVAGAEDAVAHDQVEPGGKVLAGRVHVDQLGREVGIDRPDDEAQSFTRIGPTTSTSCSSGGVMNTTTSFRAESGSRSGQLQVWLPPHWFHAPSTISRPEPTTQPPTVGTGFVRVELEGGGSLLLGRRLGAQAAVRAAGSSSSPWPAAAGSRARRASSRHDKAYPLRSCARRRCP